MSQCECAEEKLRFQYHIAMPWSLFLFSLRPIPHYAAGERPLPSSVIATQQTRDFELMFG